MVTEVSEALETVKRFGQLMIQDLPEGEWREATVDMTLARRPDGTGGPLAADERIDDIQLYVPAEAELRIDDIVLFEAAPEGETEPFPRRVIFTGWFDTGKQGEEWPGSFEIVKEEPPGRWKAARSVPKPGSDRSWIRIGLRGERPLGSTTRVRFRYLLRGQSPQLTTSGSLEIGLGHTRSGTERSRTLSSAAVGRWAEARVDFDLGPAPGKADELCIEAPPGAELTVDDVLLYEPGEVESRAF